MFVTAKWVSFVFVLSSAGCGPLFDAYCERQPLRLFDAYRERKSLRLSTCSRKSLRLSRRSLCLSGGSLFEKENNTEVPSVDSPMKVFSFRSWDWVTGRGKKQDVNISFTVFRNRVSRAAIEFVHDDHITCFGFFRFFSSDIFLFEPESPLYANFAKDCPAYCCFVNGHYTGDFLMAPNLYHHLSNLPERSQTHHQNGDLFNIYLWNASIECNKIVLSRPDCAPARIVLTDDGFVYKGAPDRYDFVRDPPTGVILENSDPPRKLELDTAATLTDVH